MSTSNHVGSMQLSPHWCHIAALGFCSTDHLSCTEWLVQKSDAHCFSSQPASHKTLTSFCLHHKFKIYLQEIKRLQHDKHAEQEQESLGLSPPSVNLSGSWEFVRWKVSSTDLLLSETDCAPLRIYFFYQICKAQQFQSELFQGGVENKKWLLESIWCWSQGE